MKRAITKISDANFDSMVLFPKKPAVVLFSADWSESSAAMRAVFERTAEKFRQKAAFYELNVDANPVIPRAYGVRRLPAILTFADGRLLKARAGFIAEAELCDKIERLATSGRIYETVAVFSKKTATRVGWLLSELF